MTPSSPSVRTGAWHCEVGADAGLSLQLPLCPPPFQDPQLILRVQCSLPALLQPRAQPACSSTGLLSFVINGVQSNLSNNWENQIARVCP